MENKENGILLRTSVPTYLPNKHYFEGNAICKEKQALHSWFGCNIDKLGLCGEINCKDISHAIVNVFPDELRAEIDILDTLEGNILLEALQDDNVVFLYSCVADALLWHRRRDD